MNDVVMERGKIFEETGRGKTFWVNVADKLVEGRGALRQAL